MHHATSGDLGALDKFIALQPHSCFNLVSVLRPSVFSELSVPSSSQSGYFACIIIIQNTRVTVLVQFYLPFKHIFASHTFCKLKTPVIKLRSPFRASTGGCGGGLIACLKGEA